MYVLVCMVVTYSRESVHQPGKVANPARGQLNRENELLLTVCMYIYVCMYVFIKLHITTQSGPVILVILCHSH